MGNLAVFASGSAAAMAAGMLLAERFGGAGQARDRSALVIRAAGLAYSQRSFDQALDELLKLMARDGLRGATVALVDERDRLFIAAFQGDLDRRVRRSTLAVGEGIMGGVAATGLPVSVGDLDDPGPAVPANRALGSNARIRSLIAAPVVMDGQVVGVVEVDSGRPHRFTDDDLVALTRIGGTIGRAAAQHEVRLRPARRSPVPS